MRRLITLTLALTAVATAQTTKVGMVYDAGTKFDKSFNQSAYEGSQRAQKELGVNVTDFEPGSYGAIPGQLQKFAAEQYNLVFGVGFANNKDITEAATANPKGYYALIDDVSSNTSNVASVVFKEEEGSYLAGYIAALTSSTGVIGFVGGMEVPLIYKFAAGFKAGARAANPDIKIYSRYVGKTPEAWNDPATAYRLADTLKKQGADIIFAAAGASGRGVISYVQATQCVKASDLPGGVTFTSNNFAALKKSAAYTKACAGNTRPMFFIGVDANQNYLGDFDKNPATMNHGLTSMLKRVDNAVYAIIKTVTADRFRGGEIRFGLKEGGVGYAVDEYNRALLPTEITRQVEQQKNRIIRGLVRVPSK